MKVLAIITNRPDPNIAVCGSGAYLYFCDEERLLTPEGEDMEKVEVGDDVDTDDWHLCVKKKNFKNELARMFPELVIYSEKGDLLG